MAGISARASTVTRGRQAKPGRTMPSTKAAAANTPTSSQSRRPMGGASAGRGSCQMERRTVTTAPSLGIGAPRRTRRKNERQTMPSARRTPASGPMRPPPGSASVDLPILTTTEPMMSTRQPTTTLEDQPVPVRAKLAAAWTSFMFLYAYVDILNFFTPGVIEDILDGRVFEFDLSQTFSTTALTLVAIPILMVVLSMTLPARANRITNLIVASLYIPITAFNAVGESWLYFYGLGIALEVILLALILRYAWTWPRTAPSATMATSPDRETVRARPQE